MSSDQAKELVAEWMLEKADEWEKLMLSGEMPHDIPEIYDDMSYSDFFNAMREITEVTGSTSDGYHTFDELYKFRMLYNAALFNEWSKLDLYDVHKSERHNDGEYCFGGGWFVVVAILPGGQITNHYENKYSHLFDIPTTNIAKYEFDGHTSNDVADRLSSLLTSKGFKMVIKKVKEEFYQQWGVHGMPADKQKLVDAAFAAFDLAEKVDEPWINAVNAVIEEIEVKQDQINLNLQKSLAHLESVNAIVDSGGGDSIECDNTGITELIARYKKELADNNANLQQAARDRGRSGDIGEMARNTLRDRGYMLQRFIMDLERVSK